MRRHTGLPLTPLPPNRNRNRTYARSTRLEDFLQGLRLTSSLDETIVEYLLHFVEATVTPKPDCALEFTEGLHELLETFVYPEHGGEGSPATEPGALQQLLLSLQATLFPPRGSDAAACAAAPTQRSKGGARSRHAATGNAPSPDSPAVAAGSQTPATANGGSGGTSNPL